MTDVRTKFVPPTINELAFNCPHCGALAKQFWHSIHAHRLYSDKETPPIWTEQNIKDQPFEEIKDHNERTNLIKLLERMALGRPFSTERRTNTDYIIHNMWISQCYNCDEVSVWLYDRLIWPTLGTAPVPNSDLPKDALKDYLEASGILDSSPRGAAALLRLALQKLCKHLGEKGENINADIASLVKKGLDVRVQQALDVVRVVGNNAVHPGQIDLSDDRAAAEKLFSLINLITEIMITQPKHVSAMFGDLPESARMAIEKRDKKA
ncbi:MAG: DUF4145 domain-containing protein [Rhodospirillales bacterium]